MERGFTLIKMVMCSQVFGLTMLFKGSVLTNTQMGLGMRETGKMTYLMDRVKRLWQMAVFMREIMSKDSDKGMDR